MAMNLGNERLREVNSSRPELVHSSSQHSIAAASDDFHSISNVAASSSEEATTVIRHDSPQEQRYQTQAAPTPRLTPPQPQQPTTRSPPPDYQEREVRMSRSGSYPAMDRPHDDLADYYETIPNTHEHTTPRASGVTVPAGRIRGPSSPTDVHFHNTIGAPLIEHRIPETNQPPQVHHLHTEADRPIEDPKNQLTVAEHPPDHRPEMNPVAAAATAANPNVYIDNRYSIDRRPGSSEYNRRDWKDSRAGPVPTPGVDPRPELHFALDQLTRDEDIRGHGRDSMDTTRRTSEAAPRPSRTSDTSPIVPRDYRKSLTPPRKPVPVTTRDTPVASDRTAVPTVADVRNEKPLVNDAWISAATNQEYRQYGKLNFVPIPLRIWSLLGLIILILFMIATLVVVSIHSALSPGLNKYDGTGTELYFVYKYMPQLIAAIIVVWLHVVQGAIQRILPFVLLMSHARKRRSADVLATTPLFLSNYLLPNLSPFQDGEIMLGICNIIFWLTLFTVPLAATVFTPLYYTSLGHWTWSGVQGVCWTLIPLYFLLVLALFFVFFRFNLRPTGLKWDPVSIADIMVLLRRANRSLIRHTTGPKAGRLDSRPASLGLWRSASDPHRLSHGIGAERDVEAGRGGAGGFNEKASPDHPIYDEMHTVPSTGAAAAEPGHSRPRHASTFESWQTNDHLSRFRWLPWFLKPSLATLWIAIALVLLIAFLVVSWVNRAVQAGWSPDVPAGPNAKLNFSSANFLYGFLPALLGMFLYIFWLPIDAYFRALQPYASMQTEPGAPADKSLLLGYNSHLPLSVTVHALINRHLKVAWISFVSLVAITIPVIAGGVFEAQYVVGTQDTINEIASTPGYIALCVFVTVYALSYLTIFPGRKRRVPHGISTVADVGDWVVGGPLLNDPAWRDPVTKADLVGRLTSGGRLTGEMGSSQLGALFRFGEHVGSDGTERVGIYRG